MKNNGSIARGFCSHYWPLPRHWWILYVVVLFTLPLRCRGIHFLECELTTGFRQTAGSIAAAIMQS